MVSPGVRRQSAQVNYTDGFKAQMVRRMTGPTGMSANALSKEVGVSQSQLSRWLRQAGTLPPMSPTEKDRSPKKWTPEEKLRVLAQAHGLDGEALGALLRREGLHEADLKAWRDAAAGALAAEAAPSPVDQRREASQSKKRVRELERELRRKDKALAETAAMLVLEKKLKALNWDNAGEDGDTDDETEK